jgi:hypothetical protein
MKTNLTISRSTDVEKTYPICNDGDIFIAKDVFCGYVANTLFICDCFSDNKDPKFSAITLYKVSDGTIRAKYGEKIRKQLVDKFYGSITITSNNE